MKKPAINFRIWIVTSETYKGKFQTFWNRTVSRINEMQKCLKKVMKNADNSDF